MGAGDEEGGRGDGLAIEGDSEEGLVGCVGQGGGDGGEGELTGVDVSGEEEGLGGGVECDGS